MTFPGPKDRRALAGLTGVFALWVSPLLVAPPLFSRDAYTYGAEGELVSRGINPYTHGLQALGRSTFLHVGRSSVATRPCALRPGLLRDRPRRRPPHEQCRRHLGGVSTRGAARRGAHRDVCARPGPVLWPRSDDGVRAGRAQSPGLALVDRRDAQRRHHVGPVGGRPDPRTARPPGARDRPVRPGRAGQGPVSPRGGLHRVGVGRPPRGAASPCRARRRVRRLGAGRHGGGVRGCRGSAGTGSSTFRTPEG